MMLTCRHHSGEKFMSIIPAGKPAKKGQLADTVQTAPTTGNVQATSSLGQAAPAIPFHAKVLTVMPLPSNAPVILMTPDQIGALGPPRPKRLESLEFGPMTTRRSGGNLLCSFQLQGVALSSPLTIAILQLLDQ